VIAGHSEHSAGATPRELAPVPRLAEVGARAGEAPGTRAAGAHFGARDRQIQAQLGACCRGAWLDFVLNRRGEIARRKLAWISSSGDQCLIVNQRGARVAEPELAEVAHEIRCGRARVVRAEAEGLVERALRTVVEQLSAATTGGSQAPAATMR